MAILCLNASLETLQPLCYCRTHRLQGDLCHCLHKGSLQALQAVVTLLAFHVLQNSPQFTVQGFEVCTPQGPILGADEGQKVPPQPFWSCFGLVGRSQVLLEDPFLTTEEGHLNPAPVPWGLCDPSPLWLTFLFKLSRILTSPFTYFIVRSS